MRELTSSNPWPTPLRGANQPLDRQLCHENRTLRPHYHGKVASQLAHWAVQKEEEPMTVDALQEHAFTKAVFDAVRPVIMAEHDHHQRHGREAEYIPDEYEFYLMRVGNRLATLLSHCEQLAHAILFISNYRQTPSLARAGISRTKHLRYNVKSYIIRTQTLYDLVLKLIDAVFHLMNADPQCRHTTIIQNLKVKLSQIPTVLKPLRKKLTELEQARHTVVHRVVDIRTRIIPS